MFMKKNYNKVNAHFQILTTKLSTFKMPSVLC